MNSPPLAGRAARIDDIQDLYELVRRSPGLPMPRTGPDRASLDYRYIDRAAEERVIVADTAAKLSRHFGVTFAQRVEPAGDGTPRYLLEAKLASGLTLVIVSRVTVDLDGQGERLPELAGAA